MMDDVAYEAMVIHRAESGSECGWCGATERGDKQDRWPHTSRIHKPSCEAATWLGMQVAA